MKKILFIFVILALVISLFSNSSRSVLAQSDTDAGDVATGIFLGAIEDQLLEESAKEVSGILNDFATAAKKTGEVKRVGPLIRSIKRNMESFKRASQHLSVPKCSKAFQTNNANFDAIVNKLTKLEDDLCSNLLEPTVSRTFHPLAEHCNPFLLNFQSCVCMHHPEREGCGGSSMSGMSEGAGEGGEDSMAGEGMSTECLSDEDFEDIFDDLSDTFEGVADVIGRDTNGNGIPDACENNKKPMARMHGGKKK